MTFYKLWSGKAIQDEEDLADYFRDDAEYFMEVSRKIDRKKNIERMVERCENAIREYRCDDLRERDRIFISSIFVGDAEWNEPVAQWMPFPKGTIYKLCDGQVHATWMEFAKKYGDVSELKVPSYSTPETLKFEGKTISEFRLDDSQREMLMTAVLHAEWYEYVADSIDLGLEKDFRHKARTEIIELILGDRESLSQRVEDYQRTMFELDVKWIDDIERDFDMNSWSLDRFKKSLKQFIQESFD